MHRDKRCMYMAHVHFYVCCSKCVGMFVVCLPLLKIVGVLSLEVLKYVCVRDVMDVVFSVCIVTRGVIGDRVWEVLVFRHSDVVWLCLVCILWQFSMLHSA